MVARKWNAEETVNTTTFADQNFPAVAALAGGAHLVVFTDRSSGNDEIRGRLYGADGNPIVNDVTGNANDFLINTTATSDQRFASAAGLAGGGFVVVYEDLSATSTGGPDLRARLFDGDGTPLVNGVSGTSTDFVVNSSTDNTQEKPSVAGLAGGGFVVVWADSSHLIPDNFDIRARVFAADGTPAGNDFVVNVATGGPQNFAAVAALAGGGFIVVYQDAAPTGSDIKARLFDASGTAVSVGGSTAEFVVNTTTSQTQQNAAVAALSGGGFVVAFADNSSGNTDVRVRVFDAGGNPISVNGSTADFVANTTTTGDQLNASVAATANGGFLVSWQDNNTSTDGSGTAIAGQLFDAAGNKVGGELVINTTTDDAQSEPASILLADGRIVVAWHDHNQGHVGGDASAFAVRSQILDPREGIVTGTPEADVLYGIDVLGDSITALAGNDALFGLAGNDTLDAGEGNDTLEGGAGNDALNGGTGTDTATYASAAAGVRVSLAIAGGQNTLGAGTDTLSAIERLTGSGFDDTLTGGSGNNVLDGGEGNDTLEGGAGNDTLNGRAGSDTASYAGAAGDVTVSLLNSGGQNTGGAGKDTLTSMENLTGSAFNDTLTGNAGANVLNGGAGADRLIGGAGGDTLIGGTGGDLASYANAAAGVTASLASAAGNTGDAAGNSYSSIEGLLGSRFADVLTGNSSSNSLNGGRGADDLNGGGDADFLSGGGGLDILTGGGGGDTFLFEQALASGNVATVVDFAAGSDVMSLSLVFFAAAGPAGALDAAAFHIGNGAHDADDRITYNAANGRLFYDADGTGAQAAKLFAVAAPGLSLTANDFVLV